jgi:MarR family transcriptional regulator for hemolysin
MIDMSISPLLEAYRSMKREITLIASAELKSLNLGEKQMAILFYLAENRGLVASDLARHTQSDRASVTRALQSLESAGFLRRKSDPADSRRAELELTAKGRNMAEKLEAIRGEVIKRIAGTLSAKELKELERLMRSVAEGLSNLREQRE